MPAVPFLLTLCPESERPREPDWVLVVHPVRSAAETVAAALAAGDHGSVVSTTASVSAAALALAERPGAGLVLVHVDGTDPFRADGWAGHRALARLLRAGRGEIVALTARGDRAAEGIAARAGLASVVGAPASPGDRFSAGAFADALANRRVPSADPAIDPSAEADFARWFRGAFATPWKAWFEQGCAVVAGGGEMVAQSRRLEQELGDGRDGHRLLRELRETLMGEIGGNEVGFVAEALRVLGRLARVKPIDAKPYAPRSLRRTAAWLREDPALAREAGLTIAQVAGVLAVDDAQRHRAICGRIDLGRPPAEVWRLHRDAAIAVVIAERVQSPVLRRAGAATLSANLDAALDAVHDAVRDRERAAGEDTPAWDAPAADGAQAA